KPYWAYLIALVASVQGIFIFLQLLPIVNLYLICLDFISKAAIFFTITFLILQLRKLLDDFAEQASTDYLTGAHNRRYFYEVCSTELARAWRYQQPLTLVFIDIDDFKKINDIHGHQVGDQILVDTVDIIRADLREGDLLGRIGGDEFAIMLHQTDQQQAQLILERIKEHLVALKNSNATPVTYSMGVATYLAEKQISFDALVAHADQAMYAIKESSKNAIEFVSI
ncbi:MAG TPA: GGDEF domain-containing protein, partial [Methyloradius sp.]